MLYELKEVSVLEVSYYSVISLSHATSRNNCVLRYYILMVCSSPQNACSFLSVLKCPSILFDAA